MFHICVIISAQIPRYLCRSMDIKEDETVFDIYTDVQTNRSFNKLSIHFHTVPC